MPCRTRGIHTTQMPPPRKHRNEAERNAIADEVSDAMCRLPIASDDPAAVQLRSVLDAFRRMEQGSLSGRIEVPELGLGCVLEYELPTRRIARHFVRVKHSGSTPKAA